MRFEQSPDIKYQDWIVYDEGLRYLGSLRPPPDGVWAATGYWAYFGDDDPYCYLEISYDTWWLFESPHWKDHCLREFLKLNCIFVEDSKLLSDQTFLRVKRVEDCLGIKGTRRMIKESRGGWYRLHLYQTSLVTSVGPLVAIIDKGEFIQIHGSVLLNSLVFNGTGFLNAHLEEGSRVWLHPSWLMVRRGNSFEDLVDGAVWLDGDRTRRTVAASMRGTCGSLLTIGGRTLAGGISWPTNPAGDDQPQIGCQGRVCICPTYTREALIDHILETAIEVNREDTWYSSIFNSIKRLFFDLIKGLLSGIFGDNWEWELLFFAVVYYVVSNISRSVGLGVAVAVVIAYNYASH